MVQEKKKRIVTGKSSTDLVFSAYVRNNEEIFPLILSLYVPVGAEIADVTYGKGVFWKRINQADYHLHFSDIKMGIDCRNLPYDNQSMDCVVLDPPYMEGFYRRNNDHFHRNCIRA